MPDVTHQRKVTFSTGLPLGTRATFTHEGQTWVALPLDKLRAERVVTDLLIGVLNQIRGQMTRWLAANPEDATRVGMLLQAIAHADAIATQASVDKSKARTA